MQHEDYKELLALDAAGALDEVERGPLEEHLSSCEECRAELHALTNAAAALVYTVAPVAPPAYLRARILESVHALDNTRQDATARSTTNDVRNVAVDLSNPAGDGPNARNAPAVKEDLRGLLSRFSLWQLLRARPSLAFGAMAAALAVVVLGVSTFMLWGSTETLRSEIARLNARLNESERELAGERGELARMRDVNDVLAAPGASIAQLAGKPPAPTARAVVAYDRKSGRAVMLAAGLPQAPAGKAYQLWFIAGGKPLPGGTFKVDAEGRARLSDHIPEGIGQVASFAVTLEREGGESAPKGDMYLLSPAS